jgi:hypothetical protein
MNELQLRQLLGGLGHPAILGLQHPGILSLVEGERNAIDKLLNQKASPSLPEIPWLHEGKLFNLDSRNWTGGRAQSLDFYLQPSLSRKGVGIEGGGILLRKSY